MGFVVLPKVTCITQQNSFVTRLVTVLTRLDHSGRLARSLVPKPRFGAAGQQQRRAAHQNPKHIMLTQQSRTQSMKAKRRFGATREASMSHAGQYNSTQCKRGQIWQPSTFCYVLHVRLSAVSDGTACTWAELTLLACCYAAYPSQHQFKIDDCPTVLLTVSKRYAPVMHSVFQICSTHYTCCRPPVSCR